MVDDTVQLNAIDETDWRLKWTHNLANPMLCRGGEKDKYGWPIETWHGRPFSSVVRIVFQNTRKVTG